MEKIKSEIKFPKNQEPEVSADIIICGGDNESDLITAFRERYKFKQGGTPIRLPEGFDFLAKGSSYGKVDTMGRVIVPKKESLVKVDSKFTGNEEIWLNKDLYALYLDFFENLKLDFAVGKLNINAFLEVFQIQKGAGSYEESELDYKDGGSMYFSEIYLDQVFPDTTNIIDNAKDFPSYLDIILKLFELNKLEKFSLYSEYLLTSANLITNSGLIFETNSNISYDDNKGKFANYYQYPTYGRVICFLYLYGMRYDANVPWRFVLDLNLDPTVKKMKGISKQQFFDKNFDLIEGTYKEMRLFFETIFLSYLELLEEQPLYYRSGQFLVECGKGGERPKRTKTKSYYRKIYSPKEFDDFFEKNFEKLLYQYALTLNAIYKKRTDIRQILLNISNKLKKGLDKEAIVRYTFNKMKYC